MPPILSVPLSDLDQVDLKLLARRLAQLEVQLSRIADAAELELKFKLIKANTPLSALRDAVEDPQPPPGKPAVEVLQQTHEEIEELNAAFVRAEERFGKGRVPLDLDLYAEVEKHREGNAGEEP